MRRSLAFSLVIHALTGACFYFLSLSGLRNELKNQEQVPESSIEVKTLTEKAFQKQVKAALNPNEKQIVQMDERLKSKEAPTTKTEEIFLSKENQKVDRNTRAKRVGKFKNVLEEGIRKKDFFKLTKENLKAPKIDQKTGLTQKTGRLMRHPASFSEQKSPAGDGEGFSATDDYLEDVAIGANTLLNSQQYIYYGFFERMRELLLHRWRKRVTTILSEAQLSGQTLSEGSKITKLKIQLNPDGTLNNTHMIGSSGYEELDNAARIAFTEASPFPHPPKGMVENGLIDIRWDFVVVAEKARGINFKLQRGPAGGSSP